MLRARSPGVRFRRMNQNGSDQARDDELMVPPVKQHCLVPHEREGDIDPLLTGADHNQLVCVRPEFSDQWKPLSKRHCSARLVAVPGQGTACTHPASSHSNRTGIHA